MSTKLKKAIEILKKDGLLILTKKSFNKTTKFIYYPICFSKVKKFNSFNIKNLINFVFNDCHGLIKPAQVEYEISELLKILDKQKPKFLLEIGTAKGGTLFLFSKIAYDDAFIISVDLPGGKFGAGYPSWKIKLYKSFVKINQKINLIRANSHDNTTLENVKSLLGKNKLDFLFIDGDHTYDGVKKDFGMYSPLVKKGGIIALHDIAKHPLQSDCKVNKFWDEIKSNYKSEEIIEDKNQGWAGIGLIKK
ncbi:MAG: class I SAM-dependent methyltransferase [Candidatus Woesearchaeota archaeon]